MNAQLQAQEKRRFKRFDTRLKVYDQGTDSLVGYAQNLSIGGMMIVTQEPLVKNQELRIWFGAAKEEKHLNRIFLSAYTVWISFNENKERLYYSGLHFVSPSEATLDSIQELMYDLEG